MLGDHIHQADAGQPACAAQVVRAFERFGGSAMIGMQPVEADELPRVGVARGQPVDGRVYVCTDFVEKPDPLTAEERLVTPGLEAGQYLAHSGIYVFTGEIFEHLARLQLRDRPAGEEVQLADAQASLLAARAGEYRLYRLAGRALDTGNGEKYAQAFEAYRRG